MKQLIVFAHPNPKSFGAGIVDTIVKASEDKGIETKVRDLYSIKFDPILKGEDFVEFQKGNIPEDIKAEQDHIKWADVITFVYPVWWAGLPAMIKGYVDRVFSYGFAYAYIDGVPQGLLKGKKALLFSTTGTPNEMYSEMGMHKSMKQTSDEGIFNFSGLEVIEHVFFGGVPTVEDETRKNYLEEVKKVIKEKL